MKKIIIITISLVLAGLMHAQTPQPPTYVNAGVTGSSAISVGINWTYMAPYTSYQIWRAQGLGSTYSLIFTKEAVTNSSLANYIDNNNIQSGTEYCYKIKTCNGSNCSGFSSIDCHTTATLPPPPTYSVSGIITENGTGISGVAVSFWGFQGTSNASGNYGISNVNSGANGLVIPSKTGYSFSPTNYYINDLQANTILNFTATLSNPIPSTPGNFEVSPAGTNSIQLIWNTVNNATSYKVFNASNTLLATITSTNYIVSGLDPGISYCFKVKACNSNGCSDYSTTECSTTSNLVYYTISGKTKELNNITIPNATINFIGNPPSVNLTSVTSASDGTYIRNNVPSGWHGIVSASKSGYIFSDVVVSTVSGNLPGTHLIGTTQSSPAISIINQNISFPNTTIGQTTVENFTIVNGGNSQLVISSITVPPGFSTNWTNGNINAGGDQEVTISFTPTASMYYQGNIEINSNAGNQTITLVSVTGTGIQVGGNCLYTDVPTSHYAYNAVSFLCNEGLLDDDGYCEPDDPINRAAIAKLAYLSIGLNTNPVAGIINQYPSPFYDLQEENADNLWYFTYAKNLYYLEYDNGIPPFEKASFYYHPSNFITRGEILRVLLESWHITIQNATSAPFSDVPLNHKYVNYIYTAKQLGIVQTATNYYPSNNALRAEVFMMLYNIMNSSSINSPTITINDFFIPGNFSPENFSAFKGLHSGNFNFYTKTSFSIPSIGLPLIYAHTYNSYSNELVNEFFPIMPLGFGWSHSFNSYIVETVPNTSSTPGEYSVVIVQPDGGLMVYDANGTGSFTCITDGVYSTLEKLNSSTFRLTTKSKIEYTYQKLSGTDPDFPYVLTSIKDRNNNTVNLSYQNAAKTGFKRLLGVTGTAGRSITFQYFSGTDLISTVTDPGSRTIHYTYNTLSTSSNQYPNLVSFTNAKGGLTTYTFGNTAYDEHLLLSITLPKGNTITNQYQDRKLISTQTNNANPTSYVYQRNYNQQSTNNYVQTTVTDPKGIVSEMFYNQRGQVVEIDNPNIDGTINYNSTHLTKPSNITINNRSSSFAYDSNGNITSVSLPLSVSHQFQYNSFNDITQYTDPRGKIYSYTYNSTGNLTAAQTPRGTTTMSVNNLGLVTSVTNPEGITINYSYDSYGNAVGVSAPENITTSSTFDILSRLTGLTNPNGISVSYQYDANDNMLNENRAGIQTQYNYDANDNMTAITNANGGTTSLVYNFDNDFLESTSFGSYTDNFTYNNLTGRLLSQTDPSGNTVTYNYYADGKIQSLATANSITSYTYNNQNLVQTIMKSGNTITYSYDDLNRKTSINYNGEVVSYTYDQASNLTSITYPGNKVVNYTYYNDNLLHTVQDWNSQTTTYLYRDDGLVDQVTYPNGSYCEYQYDNAGRMTGTSWKKANNSIICSYAYSLDPAGNHTTETVTEPYTSYTLNSQNVSYSYNSVNRIQTAGNTSFSFNNNGTLQSKGNRVYTFNEFEMLTGINSQGFTAQYVYDPINNRRQKTVNGITTKYTLDILNGSNILIERDGSSNPMYYYIYGLGMIYRISATNQTEFYHYDYRGSTIAMTNNSGTIINKYQYGPYGEILQEQEQNSNPFKYVGAYGVMYEDSFLYFMRARYYDAIIGRFIGKDPIWSTNLYLYTENNPITGTDPLGTVTFKEIMNDEWYHIKQNGKGLRDLGYGSFYLGVGLVEEFSAGAAIGTGNKVQAASLGISGLENINKASKYWTKAMHHGLENHVEQDCSKYDGIFDPLLESRVGKIATTTNQIYGAYKFFTDPFKALNDAKALNTYLSLPNKGVESYINMSIYFRNTRSGVNKFYKYFLSK